jgi:hypothetical protein
MLAATHRSVQRSSKDLPPVRERPDAAEPAQGPVSAALSRIAPGGADPGDGGDPLPSSVRGWFEPRLGVGLGGVRVHTGPSADASARGLNARAYTVADRIAFATGEYRPHEPRGRALLAHELAHVAQTAHRGMLPRPGTVSAPGDVDEVQADRAASVVLAGGAVGAGAFRATAAPAAVRRQATPAGGGGGGGGGGTSTPVKNVSIDCIRLRGASHSRGHDVQRANAIFAPANVHFAMHRVEVSDTDSDAWLGSNNAIAVSTSCTPTSEEVAAYTGAASLYHTSSRIRAFFVRAITGANLDAHSYQPGCGASTDQMVEVANGAGGRELAHELGHILLNEGNSAHSTDPHNLMADPDPGDQLDAAQRATIYANA